MENMFLNGVNPKEFAKFVWPSVLMTIVMALYYAMDSVLVSNLVGEEALAALSIAYPLEGLMWGVSLMLAAGSSAIVAINMGEGEQQKANERFSLACVVSLALGCICTIAAFIFMDEIISFLGATHTLRELCYDFTGIFIWGFPAAFLGVLFEYYVRVDGSPGYTLFLYAFNGIVHLVVAFVLMKFFDMGIAGAAYGNIAGLVAMVLAGLGYFIFKDTKLAFTRIRSDWKFIGHCFANGSSEMVSEASSGITTFFFNTVMIGLAGATGVAAVSIVLNIHYMFISIHLGFIMGVAPLISFFYGAGDFAKVNTFIRYSKNFILIISVAGALLCLIFAEPVVMAFERPGSELYDMALTGTRLLSVALLLCGFNIYASGFFTAYGNGPVSALISMSRALVAVIVGMYLLSWLFGVTGIWFTLAFAEFVTLAITFSMFRKYRDIYHYRLK